MARVRRPIDLKQRQGLPTEEQVWSRVREFAEQHEREKEPLRTLGKAVSNRKGVSNRITRVTDDWIERISDKGRRPNGSKVKRSDVLRVWRYLVAHGHTRELRPTYFTLALLQGAMSDFIENPGDGTIALRGRVPSRRSWQTYSYAERSSISLTSRARDARPDFELCESLVHWRIKHYIHEHPDDALATLSGGPWTEAVLEVPLRVPTSDRIDVIVRGADGRYVLVEVKPRVGGSAQRLYAQVAKYRAIWEVLHDLEPGGVRCALAAPQIPPDIARHMYERHQIESVAVRVPRSYVAPPRET